MYGKTWKTSERSYDVIKEKNVRVPMSDGISLNATVFRPDGDGPFPAILGYFPYDMEMQSAPVTVEGFSSVVFKHPGQELANASIEAGDSMFYARRGYCHVLVNIRGCGASEGQYTYFGPRELKDGYEAIEWIAAQPWCDGNIGMFGVSYFAQIQQYVASTNPPHLKCLFGPWASTDLYRDGVYHGGIQAYRFWRNWSITELSHPRCEGYCRTHWEKDQYEAAIREKLNDPEIAAEPDLVNALKNPDEGSNPILVDQMLNPFYNEYWEQRLVDYEKIKIPAYIGCDWGHLGLHLPGCFRSWAKLSGPKKMILAPPAYLDRPVYQLQYESLRWFDHWLKGVDNGIMDGPPVKVWINGTHGFREEADWPLPGTRWTEFYLHEKGLIDEHEYRVNEGFTSVEDSPWRRDRLQFTTPVLVEDMEVIGPSSLTLYASATEDDILFFVSLWDMNEDGEAKILTRGWLRASHRALTEEESTPWKPVHPHISAEKLVPNGIYKFDIEILPTGTLFPAGHRIMLQISFSDDKPNHSMEGLGVGHIRGQKGNRVTIYHDADHPSCLLLPITRGNVLGTFRSGGYPYFNNK
ncbi:MAG: CocE/NonD family hydrolase [Clostridiales bacterium]|nr:CocE/NonD family hydrolase [Clostridiales bacterium]